MEDLHLLAQASEVPLFAYPARLTISGSASNLSLAVVIKDISHSGAMLEFEAGHLPDNFAERAVKLEFVSAGGSKVEISGRVSIFQRRSGGQAAAWIAFENIHLPQVEEIQALRASPRKDHRLLWELWDILQEGSS
jgi:hypothetical protein